MKPLADVVTSLFRAVGPTAAQLFILVFAVAALHDISNIRAALTSSASVWAAFARPLALAAALASLRGLAPPFARWLWALLSPSYRFRNLASDADALADELSDSRNFLPRFVDRPDPPPLAGTTRLRTKIAAFAADLDNLGVSRIPPIDDVSGWQRILPVLRSFMRTGDLAHVRAQNWADPREP